MAAPDRPSGVRTFLIADIRGYSRYTEQCGDEAAAALSRKFARISADAGEEYGSEFVEVRGDEAMLVFTSARAAIRAGVDLQARFREASERLEVPLRVGIGIDSGEAVQVEDGSFRGSALNVASRLCGRAAGGEVIISEATSRLAGRLTGLHYSDGGRHRLKNIAEPLHVYKVYSELDAPPPTRWAALLGTDGRALSLRLALLVTLIAAGTAAAVVYFTAGNGAEPGVAGRELTAEDSPLAAVVPDEIWRDCVLREKPRPRADETAECDPIGRTPDRWEISSYKDGRALAAEYERELRKHPTIQRDNGTCSGLSWGGEREWFHGPGKPGGRLFCYFDRNDAVIVWTHERRNQPSHVDVMVTARESGSDHPGLTRWWEPNIHLIGKAG
jgi:class 3 adenylate cyclase